MRKLKLVSILVLLTCLWPVQANAQNHPAANGGCATTGSGCAFKTTAGNVNPGAGQLMIAQVQGVHGDTFTGCTDTYGVTWTQFSAGQGVWSNSNLGVTNVPQTAYWAKTGANSGAETVTCTTSPSGNVTYGLASWAATDVNVGAANPEDTSVFKEDTNANTCTNPSPQSGTYSLGVTNDIVMSTIGYNSSFDSPNITSTSGPVQQDYTGTLGAAAGATKNYINFSGSFSGSTGTLAALAIQASVNTTWTWNSCVGTAGNAGIYLIAIKGPQTSGVRHKSTLTNYRPSEKFTPLLLYTILRNWIKEAYEGRA